MADGSKFIIKLCQIQFYSIKFTIEPLKKLILNGLHLLSTSPSHLRKIFILNIGFFRFFIYF